MGHATRWSVGHGATAALLAAWILACDLWVKVLARQAGCTSGAGGHGAAAYDPPGVCQAIPLIGDGLRLRAASVDGGPFGLLAGTLGGANGSLVGIGLLGLATVLTVLVWRWRWRSGGDPLALGALWGGSIALALPRLQGGERLTELVLGSVATGLGDLAFAWSIAWLAWRAIAEARA